VPDVLPVQARQLGYPVVLVVLMESEDGPEHPGIIAPLAGRGIEPRMFRPVDTGVRMHR
jgi:hypothetical protein